MGKLVPLRLGLTSLRENTDVISEMQMFKLQVELGSSLPGVNQYGSYRLS
jgi:hypothetical protein